MIARDVCSEMKHQARVLFALREEAREITSIHESRRLPLDTLVDPRIGGQDELASAHDNILHWVLVSFEPSIDLFVARHRPRSPNLRDGVKPGFHNNVANAVRSEEHTSE